MPTFSPKAPGRSAASSSLMGSDGGKREVTDHRAPTRRPTATGRLRRPMRPVQGWVVPNQTPDTMWMQVRCW
jgi:hypothetical protein